MTSLNTFLKTVRAPNDPLHTHVSMGLPRGVYSIGSKMNVFWKLYLEAWQENQCLYLAENPGKELPILVDIDLKIKKSLLPEPQPLLYTPDQVKSVILAYHRAIEEVVDFTHCSLEKRKAAMTCVLLEKPAYDVEIGGELYVKNGFHLHFPKLFLDRQVQQVYIIPKVKQFIQPVFDHDVIDNNSMNVHWLMYGSRKQQNEPYVATGCFQMDAEAVSIEEALADYECSLYPNETRQDIDCQGRVLSMLPRILSIFLHSRASSYFYNSKESVSTPLFDEFKNKRTKRRAYDQDSIDHVLREANFLIRLIRSSRADDRATWLRIGFCLWNLSQGDDDGLTSWIIFSEQSVKFCESECLSLWQTMRPNRYTLGTLHFYAKQDSPEEYASFVRTKIEHHVQQVIKGSHSDIAQILCNEYGHEFVCASIKNQEWFMFKNHIWIKIDSGTNLRERISSEDGILIKSIKEFKTRVDQLQTTHPEYATPGLLEGLPKVLCKCKQAPFKDNIMRECREVFYNSQFLNMLDNDPNLVAFQNGVYDCSNHCFRDGNPEDYLSIQIPIDFYDYKSMDHPDVVVVDEFFQKVFPDRDVRHYFLDQVCQVFAGGNRNKVILFWIGEGNNGKTVTQTLFEKMLGPLAIKFSTTLITGKKVQFGCANPEMARAGGGVRWAVMEEPNQDEVISSGILKSLTGNDSFWARDLFQKGKEAREIVPLFKLHMICNKLPAIKDADQATWNRIRVIPFESTFVPEQDCPEDVEEQLKQKIFPMDKRFYEKIPQMIQPLAWYLLQRYKTVCRLEQIEPEKVKVATHVYMQENDLYTQFEQQCVHQEEGKKMYFSVMYNLFKEWFRQEAPSSIIPNRLSIKKHYIKKWGELELNLYWNDKTCSNAKYLESMEEAMF